MSQHLRIRRESAALLLGLLIASAIVAGLVALPAAADRAIEIPKNAKYKGSSLSSEAAAKQGLACLQDDKGAMTCFDSTQALAASSAASREATKADGSKSASAARKRPRKQAIAAADCGVPPDAMAITQHQDFNWNIIGWVVAGYARGNWYNLTGSYANSASSVSAGNHSGYLADATGGGGQRLRLEINQCERYLSWKYFNARAESRYRN